jgi:flagellar hook-basal body complex protein FliE
MITPLSPLGPLDLSPAGESNAVGKIQESFGKMVSEALENLNSQQQQADLAMQQMHTGGERDLHEVMIAMEKADISLRYTVQVRNKALEAYQEIMRLQV